MNYCEFNSVGDITVSSIIVYNATEQASSIFEFNFESNAPIPEDGKIVIEFPEINFGFDPAMKCWSLKGLDSKKKSKILES